MSWVSIVLYLLMHAGEFISIIKQIIALLKGMPSDQKANVKTQLEDAIKYHKETGDLSKVRDVCTGIGCPSQLVSE